MARTRTSASMNADVIRMVAQERLTDRTRAELFEEALRASARPSACSTTPSEFVAHPQTRHRGFFVDGRRRPRRAPVRHAAVKLGRATPSSIRRAGVRWTSDAIVRPTATTARARRSAAADDLLLDGVRVVEFGVAAVVPEMCAVLSELGADVIKIESRANLDVLRMGSGRIELIDKNFTFNDECRGRRSVALDLTTERGRELALGTVRVGRRRRREPPRRRARAAAVSATRRCGRANPRRRLRVVAGLRPRRAVRRDAGVRAAQLRVQRRAPAVEPSRRAVSVRHVDEPPRPHRRRAAGGRRARRARPTGEPSGEGQHIEMAQTEAAAYLIGEIYLEAARSRRRPRRRAATADPDAAPHGVYPSAGDDQWVAIAVMDDDAWHTLSHGASAGTTIPSLRTRRPPRSRHATSSTSAWPTWTRGALEGATRPTLLQAHGVSAMPVMGPHDHHADPHLLERGAIVTLHHPEVGDERHIGNPLRFSRLPQRRAEAAPLHGRRHRSRAHVGARARRRRGRTSSSSDGVCR